MRLKRVTGFRLGMRLLSFNQTLGCLVLRMLDLMWLGLHLMTIYTRSAIVAGWGNQDIGRHEVTFDSNLHAIIL